MKNYSILFILSFLSAVIQAQVLPTEKLYFAPSHALYELGDTMDITGRLFRADNDSVLTPYSKYLFLELINEADSVCARQKIRVDQKGEFSTRFPIDTYLQRGQYYMRGFSQFMTNYPLETLPIISVRVGKTEGVKEGNGVNAFFYPEGGSLIGSEIQPIGVFVCDNNGTPLANQRFCIVDEKNDTVANLTTSPNGWQVLRIALRSDSSYSLLTEKGGMRFLVPLPDVNENPVVQTTINRNRLIYEIFPKGKTVNDLKLLVYHSSIGLQDVTANLLRQQKGNSLEGLFDLKDLPMGLLSVFLCDQQGHVFSETSKMFYGKQKKNIEPSFSDSQQSSAGLSISWNDTLDDECSVIVRYLPAEDCRNVSVSTVDELANYTCDLSSPHPYPSFAGADTQAWLYSAVFKRLDIQKVLSEGINFKKKPEQELVINGSVKQEGIPLHKGTAVVYQQSNAYATESALSYDGTFSLAVGDFDEEETFFVQVWNKIEKPVIYDYAFVSDTIPGVYNWKKYSHSSSSSISFSTEDRNHFSFTDNNLLPEVVIKPHSSQDRIPRNIRNMSSIRYLSKEIMKERMFQTFQQIVDYFYIYFYMAKQSDRQLDIEPPKMQRGKDNTYRSTMSQTTPSIYKLYPRRASTLGSGNVQILLDGQRVTCDEVVYMDMNLIESAEYVPPVDANRFTNYGMDGLLVLTTNRGKPEKKQSKGVYYQPSFGLANLRVPVQKSFPLPQKEGDYKVIVDLISSKYGVKSFIGDIQVK